MEGKHATAFHSISGLVWENLAFERRENTTGSTAILCHAVFGIGDDDEVELHVLGCRLTY